MTAHRTAEGTAEGTALNTLLSYAALMLTFRINASASGLLLCSSRWYKIKICEKPWCKLAAHRRGLEETSLITLLYLALSILYVVHCIILFNYEFFFLCRVDL